MLMYDINIIHFESIQTAPDACSNVFLRPLIFGVSITVSALGKEVKVFASVADGLANLFFAVNITLSCVDYIQTFIQGCRQKFFYRCVSGAFVADFATAET